MQSIAEKILEELRLHDADWCFSPKDFLALAGRDALDKAFSRLTTEGAIRRIGRGLYDVPRHSNLLETTLGTEPKQIAHAIARKHGWRIVPTGANAANQLHLSTQVPGKIYYLSDGPTKTVDAGRFRLFFKHKAPKDLNGDPMSALVIQALKYFGKERVDSELLRKIRKLLTPEQRQRLLQDTRFTTDWICEAARRIATEDCSDG